MPKALVLEDNTSRRKPASGSRIAQHADGASVLKRLLPGNPKDLAAGFIAAAAVAAIIANATLMQAGRHPAPMFGGAPPPAPSAAAAVGPVSGPLPRPRPTEAELRSVEPRSAEPAPVAISTKSPASQPATVPRPPAPIQAHADPVGDLIVTTRRVATVQQILTEFGYGQLKPTGVVGTDTQAAIQKFEHERKLPVTGQVTDRLVRELSTATGRTID